MGVSIFPSTGRASTSPRASEARVSSPPRILITWPADGLALSAKRQPYSVCHARFLGDARALSAGEVKIFRGNARVVLANVRFGLDTACHDLDAIQRHLPLVNLGDVLGLADLARALVHAVRRATPLAEGDGEVKRRVGLIKEPREQMLTVAQTLAKRNLLPAKVVATVGMRKGLPGMAEDAVTLAELYTVHAGRLRGQHPFTDAEIAALGEHGEWLTENLRSGHTPRRKKVRANTPADDRDRLWTLLDRRYLDLRRIGFHFHPEEVDAVVPPLMSATREAAADDEDEETPEPVTPA